MIAEETRIHSFLRLGYFTDYDKQICPIDFSRIERSTYGGKLIDDLVVIGMGKLNETFSEQFEIGKTNVVPLSGGLDSRLILCSLLEQTEARNIYTYTFGIKGSYDYEIGCKVAKEAGTRHAAFPIDGYTYHLDELIDTARRTDCQAVLFQHPPVWELDRRYGGAVIWSGYVGDVVAGSNLHDPPSPTLDYAKKIHIENRTFVRSAKLHRLEEEEFLPLIGGGNINHRITWDEQVFFEEAASKFTAPLILFQGFDYKTPLINTPWMDFMFSVPNRYRLKQKLMIDIGRAAFPRLFEMPSKSRLGHTFDTPEAIVRATFWLNRARKLAHQFVPAVNWPNTQYNDFNEGIRTSPDLREIVRSSIEDLKKRGICDWVDFDGIWRRHMWRMRNHGDALIVLASLEIVLKAKEEDSIR